MAALPIDNLVRTLSPSAAGPAGAAARLLPHEAVRNWRAGALEQLQRTLPCGMEQLRTASGWDRAIKNLDPAIAKLLAQPPEVSAFRTMMQLGVPADLTQGTKALPMGIRFDRNLMVEMMVEGFKDLSTAKQRKLLASLTKEFLNKKGSLDPGDALQMVFGELGPGFIKAAQVFSERPEFIGPVYRQHLAALKDRAPGVAFTTVRRVVTESLALQGKKFDEVFKSIDPAPIGIASTGQVHRATLRDGRKVVIKIIKPGTHAALEKNFGTMNRAMEKFSAMLAADTEGAGNDGVQNLLRQFMEDLSTQIAVETDLRKEGLAMLQAASDNARSGEHVFNVPQPYMDFTGRDLLVMSQAEGKNALEAARALSPNDRQLLAHRIFSSGVRTMFVQRDSLHSKRLFHMDPHAGNILVDVKNGKVPRKFTLIDWGQHAYLGNRDVTRLLPLLTAIAAKQKRPALGLIRELDKSGKAHPALEEAIHLAFSREASPTLADRVQNVVLYATLAGVRLPREMMYASKALAQLDGVARSMSVRYDPVKALAEAAPDFALAGVTPRLRNLALAQVRSVWESGARTVTKLLPDVDNGFIVPADIKPQDRPAIARWIDEDGRQRVEVTTSAGVEEMRSGKTAFEADVFDAGHRFDPVDNY